MTLRVIVLLLVLRARGKAAQMGTHIPLLSHLIVVLVVLVFILIILALIVVAAVRVVVLSLLVVAVVRVVVGVEVLFPTIIIIEAEVRVVVVHSPPLL